MKKGNTLYNFLPISTTQIANILSDQLYVYILILQNNL